MATSSYSKTYTSFSGADIVATLAGKVIGELESITYSITREKAPIYTMGDPNPRSFSRGKRGIAGTISFIVFDRDVLHQIKTDKNPVYRHKSNSTRTGSSENVEAVPVHELNIDAADVSEGWAKPQVPKYSDEVPPFDITINFLNEYGQSARMTIYGVEILNEGMGMSVDDISTSKACTFVARNIDEMTSDAYSEPNS